MDRKWALAWYDIKIGHKYNTNNVQNIKALLERKPFKYCLNVTIKPPTDS